MGLVPLGLAKASAPPNLATNGIKVSVRCDCPAWVMEWVIVSTIGSGHLEVGYGGEEGLEEACLVG